MTMTRNDMTRQQAMAQLTARDQPYELNKRTINDIPCRVFVNAPLSLAQLFSETVSDEEFLVYQQERYTFRDVHHLACRFAQALQSQYDVEHGDRVAISMRNYPEWVIAFTAVTSIGAIAVAMNAWWEADEIEIGLADCGAKVMLADEERLARLAQFEDRLQCAVIAVRARNEYAFSRSWSDVIAKTDAKAQMPQVQIVPEDSATIFYTSGSTGFPKGALATHRNILSAMMSWELEGQCAQLMSGTTPPAPAVQHATLLAVPLFHATGSHAIYLMSYRNQRKMICMHKWDPAQAAALIEQEHISTFVAPAAMTGDLVQAARETERDLSTLLTVGGGGAPRAPEQVRAIESAFDVALPNTGWGMTETNAIGTGIGGVDYLDHPASSGRTSAVVDLKIIDEAGNELAAGENGELLVRGVSVIHGYWQRPEANAETFVDGWLRTGDVAYLDDEGYLYIVDRIKDLIIRGGENIGCGEVEAALVEHPDIVEASVYAIPDERLGEEVGATVFRDNKLSEDDLRAFLATRLAKFKIPRHLQMSDQPLPRIASGKIFKRQLRDEAIAHIG